MKNLVEINKIRNNINGVLIGKEDKVELVLTALLSGGHVLLEDVPGVGKTTLANALAKSLDVSFGRIQFTPDTLPSDVTGISIYNMKTGSFQYSKGAIMHHIVLADEINRTSPKTQASLLEAMEEKQVTVDGTIYQLEEPFMVIATQNPVDFLGTYNLPEAQLDRFLMRISLGYPDKEQEIRMADNFIKEKRVNTISAVCTKETVLAMRKEVEQVFVDPDIITFIVDITKATRNCEQLSLGASPRATLALVRSSQATAYLKGRDYVIPDDVLAMLQPVLCHRMILSMEAKLNRQKAEDILQELLRKLKVPILKNDKRE